jgi:predicted metal-dependent hydrolase
MTISTPAAYSESELGNIVLQARDVKFDWSTLPMHWIPGDPFATHVFNVLHLLLPAGEEWFVDVFKQALPLIEDESLREQVQGFIGQEAMHAQAHSGVLDHLKDNGLDPTPFTDQMHWLFEKLLGPRPVSGLRAENYLIERLALVAGIEHVTAFLGDWVLNAKAMDTAGIHPVMLDLLRWHGAEEVEHRAVAFDVLNYFDQSYVRRARSYAVAMPALVWLWIRGVRFLMRNDPELAHLPERVRKPRWRDYLSRARQGLLPGAPDLAVRAVRYFGAHYHPRHEGSTAQAAAYLATSPAALAAGH